MKYLYSNCLRVDIVWFSQSGFNPRVNTMLRLPVVDPWYCSPRPVANGVDAISALIGPRPSTFRTWTGSSLGMKPDNGSTGASGCGLNTSILSITLHASFLNIRRAPRGGDGKAPRDHWLY